MNKRNYIYKRIAIILLFVFSFFPAVEGGDSKILVSTNRYVVLDDPIAESGTAGTGYYLPYTGEWGSSNNRWTGKQTTIGAIALYIDENGSALTGKTVNFTIYYPAPGNGTMATGSSVTDSSGVAQFYKNLDNAKYYGVWKVKAESEGIYSNSSFIYNWWGCAWATSGRCGGQHSGQNPSDGTPVTANSPYTMGWEEITGRRNDHNIDISTNNWSNDYCSVCHQSYDGNPTTSNVEGATAKDFYPPDVHQNIRCDNATCHNANGTSAFNNHNTGALTIGSCSSCHFRTDITKKTTLNGVVSAYSNTSNTTGTYDRYHTPNSTVPCIVCHGPMHNISKPDNTIRFTKNNDTEDTHCTACHSGRNKHNSSNTTYGGVNCTFCHSDDIHAIQVFAQNGTYVTGKTNSARGNCTNCHQNSTFITTLKSQTKAGNYTGRNPPIIPSPIEHSDDTIAGKKWNQTPGYWTNTSQVTWCQYCHGNTTHNASALGRIALFDGNNIVNSSISTSTSWCLSCHWQGYSSGANNYDSMVSTFLSDSLKVPPEISDNATYGADKSNPSYFNHSTVDKNDATCRGCHMTLNTGTAISQFIHNVTIGKNCQDCHYSWSLMNGSYNKPLAYVNSTLVNSSVHVNVSCMNCHTYIAGHPDNSTYPKWGWKWCESCHANTQDPQNNISRHLIVSDPWNNLFSGTSVVNITTCTTCHNSTLYNNSKNTFGKDKGIDCNYCHSFPDNSAG